jgi:hypothetical protein
MSTAEAISGFGFHSRASFYASALFPGHAFGYEISVYFCLLKMLRGS